MKLNGSKKVKIYEYSNCSTCKKALKFLQGKDVAFEAVAIVDQPPSLAELKKMLGYQKGELKKLFNTSGQLYRELGISEKLPKMTESAALELLSKNGKLIKRPFILTPTQGLVGFTDQVKRELDREFNADEWKKVF